MPTHARVWKIGLHLPISGVVVPPFVRNCSAEHANCDAYKCVCLVFIKDFNWQRFIITTSFGLHATIYIKVMTLFIWCIYICQVYISWSLHCHHASPIHPAKRPNWTIPWGITMFIDFYPCVCHLNQFDLFRNTVAGKTHQFSHEVCGFPVNVPFNQSINLRYLQSYIFYISRRHRTWANPHRQISMSMIDAASAVAAHAHQQQLTTRLAYVVGEPRNPRAGLGIGGELGWEIQHV